MVEHEEILNAVISSIGSASVTFVIYFHWLTLSFYLFQNIGGSNIDLTNNSLSIDDKDDALDIFEYLEYSRIFKEREREISKTENRQTNNKHTGGRN